MINVSETDFNRAPDFFLEMAIKGPVFIEMLGGTAVVIISIQLYKELNGIEASDADLNGKD